MKPDWDKLGAQYKGSRTVLIADVDCTVHQGLCGENGVQGYPTIKYYLKDGKKGGEAYNGGRDFNALKKFVETTLDTLPACSLDNLDDCNPHEKEVLENAAGLSKGDRATKVKEMEDAIAAKQKEAKALEKEWKQMKEDVELVKLAGNKPEMVEQLLNDDDFRAHCGHRTCVLAFLPHILDDGAKGRNAHLKILNGVLKANKGDGGADVGFMWTQGGDAFEIEEKLSLQFGFPAIIAINLKKEKYGVHRGIFDKDGVSQFLRSLQIGKVPLSPLPNFGKFPKAAAWDGKDGKPIEEEDL
jgi:hypothetical protein